MIEWLAVHPNWEFLWFIYVTFHDPIQWLAMAALGASAWGQRSRRQRLERLVTALRAELEDHKESDLVVHSQILRRRDEDLV